MRMTVYSILCLILSELAFLLGYLVPYVLSHLFDLALVALLRRKLFASASITGFLCGAVGGFCALSVAYIFARLSGVTGLWLLIISMVLPATGMFAYFENKLRQVADGHIRPIPLHGRLHAAMMAIPARMQFELSKKLFEATHPEQIGLEGDPLGHSAYQQSVKYLLTMTILSFVGAAIGLFLAFWVSGQ